MLKKIRRLIAPFILQLVMLATPAIVLAQGNNIIPSESIGKVNNILVVIQAIIRFILIVAFIAAFIMLLIGGIRWITAGGDEKGVASARNMITAALIGLVVVLVAYAIIRLVELFFGFQIISNGVKIPTINNAP
ncbi:hypothetical protein A3F02_03600 [Candidatus Curtissbacteria bacterium RIFCSPHIGHO2_12_FULL_38_9b]|uniref:Uncharacterized protein n=1 Tax=Candidatus Curtissbacteria bacterium RIFCSPHIGHO2_12_FULL_38_9b TaxID=1797720 RepID=A0A1F5GSW4_9BACT|nr:MAG: hypothetical protein A3F02_03600 [Candidatus Curtissbacteria bacterium RIFCSPHIGHO2_12_FULL_38_9b]